MRSISMLQPQNLAPVPPDTVTTLLVGPGVPQADDWRTSAGAVANAAAAGVAMVRVTGWSSAGSTLIGMVVNLTNTGATAPSSGTEVSTVAAVANVPIFGQGMFQVAGGSTGYSIAVNSSGYVFVEQWRK